MNFVYISSKAYCHNYPHGDKAMIVIVISMAIVLHFRKKNIHDYLYIRNKMNPLFVFELIDHNMLVFHFNVIDTRPFLFTLRRVQPGDANEK